MAFAFAIAASVIGAWSSLLTGKRRRPGTAETLGAELAGVAAEGGIEPTELVVPELAAEHAPGDQARANGQSAAATEPGGKTPG